jgi:hypothetical protein
MPKKKKDQGRRFQPIKVNRVADASIRPHELVVPPHQRKGYDIILTSSGSVALG